MRRTHTTAIAGALLLLTLGATQGQAAPATTQLVYNGGFEQPDIPGSWTTVGSIPGWDESAPGGCRIEVQNRRVTPYEGDQYVELDSWCPTGIEQQLATTPGRYYDVSYAFSPRPGTGAADNVLEARWGETVIGTHSADGTNLADGSWTLYTQRVQASSSTTTLSLFDRGTNNGRGTFVDAVSVTTVSPSSSLVCKKGGWQSYTDHEGNGFKNQGDCVSYAATGGRNLGAG